MSEKTDKYERPFRFKQFSIHQKHAAMKVGTDGALLGAWAGEGNPRSILDIGTGTGIAALMLAQRFPLALVNGIEIDDEAIKDAQKNFAEAPFADRMLLHHVALQEFSSNQKFDLIVCNPPYFENSLRSASVQRDRARHNESLGLDELFQKATTLLHEEGTFELVVPFDSSDRIEKLSVQNGFFVQHRCDVSSWENEAPVRTLWRLGFREKSMERISFFLYVEHLVPSDAFRALAKAFYLKF
jgi:tRNA1Val (adenine37-N6)-methyltransferase